MTSASVARDGASALRGGKVEAFRSLPFGMTALAMASAALALSCETRPYGGSLMVPVSSADSRMPTGCVSLGPVEGESTGRRLPRARAEIVATDWLRDAARDRGANYVRVERFSWQAAGSNGWRGSAQGTAFRCELERPLREFVCVRDNGLSTCSTR